MALDNSSASLHLSDTSTIPSSMDMSLEDKSPSTVAKLRDKTRAWSLGGRKKDQAVEKPHPPLPPPPQQIPSETHWNQNRARAETESSYASESTATPPRLLDGGFDEGGLDLDFDNFGKRRSKLMDKGLPLLSESPVSLLLAVEALLLTCSRPTDHPEVRDGLIERTSIAVHPARHSLHPQRDSTMHRHRLTLGQAEAPVKI